MSDLTHATHRKAVIMSAILRAPYKNKLLYRVYYTLVLVSLMMTISNADIIKHVRHSSLHRHATIVMSGVFSNTVAIKPCMSPFHNRVHNIHLYGTFNVRYSNYKTVQGQYKSFLCLFKKVSIKWNRQIHFNLHFDIQGKMSTQSVRHT